MDCLSGQLAWTVELPVGEPRFGNAAVVELAFPEEPVARIGGFIGIDAAGDCAAPQLCLAGIHSDSGFPHAGLGGAGLAVTCSQTQGSEDKKPPQDAFP